MQFTLQIKCDNVAFEDSAGWELARILRFLADRFSTGELVSDSAGIVVDINGNNVGDYSMED